jgi:hypothetical protein
MAARFWVGGTGTWDNTTTTHWSTTSGGGGGAAVPTSSDDVTFDANSGTAATVTIATAGANANTITVNKSDLTLTHLLVGSTVVGGATLTTGTLNTNGQTCSWGSLSSSNANARTLTLGASAITITGTGAAWNCGTITNLTVTTNTATITMTGAGALFRGNINWNGLSVIQNGSGVAGWDTAATVTVANWTRTGTAVKTDAMSLQGNMVITGTLTLTGNSATNRLLIQSSVVGTARTITTAAVSITNVDFMDITGAGAAAPFTGTSLGDALGNSGITFDAPLTLFRVGAGGSWSASNWSLTTGGATGQRVPLPQDNVNVDSGATGTVTMDMPRMGKDISFAGTTATWSLNSFTTTAFGSWLFSAGVVLSGGSGLLVLGGRGTHTITWAGKSLSTLGLTISAPGATYTAQDAITLLLGRLTVNNGHFQGNGFSHSFDSFVSISGLTRAATMGAVAWMITGVGATTWNVSATGLTFSGASGTIVYSVATTASRTFAGGGLAYGTLTYTVAGSTGALIITGANTWNGAWNLSDTTNARSVTMPAGVTQTFVPGFVFNINGSSGKLTTFTSSTPGSPWTLSKAGGTVIADWLSLTDSAAIGGAGWYAGANSTNVSGNSGWVFAVPPAKPPMSQIVGRAVARAGSW